MTASNSGAQIDRLFEADVVQDPYAYFHELRRDDPVHQVVPGTFLVTSMELVTEAVGRTEEFSSVSNAFLHHGDWDVPSLLRLSSFGYGDVEKKTLASADGEDHQRQRRVVSRKLSAANMQAMEPEFRSLVSDALSGVRSDRVLEWMGTVAEPLPMVMVARILGLPDTSAPMLKKAGYAQLEQISGFAPDESMDELKRQSIENLRVLVDAYNEARRGSTAYNDGLIGIAARAVDDEELSEIEAMGILGLMIAAGGESTTSLTGTAVRILAEHQELQSELRARPSLVPRFVEEALRWDPPFRGHYRSVTRETELGGTLLPAGSHLVLVWPAANRDATVYDEPDRVRLDRPHPRQHVGFGRGVHLCVGAPLARVEAKVAVETLLERTRTFHIDDAHLPLRYHPSLMVRRLVALPLVVEPND